MLHRSLLFRLVAMGFEQAGHRFGARPRFGRRMRTGHDVRSDHRCRRRKVWGTGGAVLASRAGDGDAVDHRSQARARATVLRRHDLCADGAAIGMVNRVVPAAELRERTMKYAKRLALVSPEAPQWGKRAINRGAAVAGFPAALETGVDSSRFALQHQDRRRKGVFAASWPTRHFEAPPPNGAPRSSK